MKLHSPIFEKKLRRGVKARIRASAALKKEYRAAKKANRRRPYLAWLFRSIWSWILGMFVLFAIRGTGHVTSGLALITLWTFVAWAVFSDTLLRILFKDPDLAALMLMPFPEPLAFRWQLEKFFKRHASYALLDQVVAFGAVAVCMRLNAPQWLVAMTCALLSWMMLLALSALCAARLPRFPYQKIASTIFIFGFAIFIAFKVDSSAVLKLFESIAPTLNLILPTGWAPSLFQLCLPNCDWMAAVLIVPVSLVLFTMGSSLALLRRRFKFVEHLTPEVADQIPAPAPESPAAAQTPQQRRLGLTAIEDIVKSRQFLHQEQPRGWFEARLWNWLRPRERALVEFAFPRGVTITKPWLLVLRNFAVMLMAALAAGTVNPSMEYWILGVGLFITLLQCLAQIWSNGNAFRLLFNSGILIHIYAAYPITFQELSTTLLKIAAIQLPPFLIYTIASAALIAHFTGLTLPAGIIFGIKAALLIFAGRFITTTMAFSGGTNDTSKLRVRTLALVLLILGCGFSFLGLAATGLFIPGSIGWLLWLAAMLDAYAFFRIYGWFYNANRFDLMKLPQR